MTEFPVASQSPTVDIVLLRNHHVHWTEEQRTRLPDGIRDSQASHILLEFKYTESLNFNAFRQIINYDTIYPNTQDLDKGEFQSFLVSSKTPNANTLKKFGFVTTEIAGIYRSTQAIFGSILVMSLNELSGAPHNSPIKCFASRKREPKQAFTQIEQGKLPTMSIPLEWFFNGLRKLLLLLKEEEMTALKEITPDYLMEEGKEWAQHMVSVMPTEDRIRGLSTEEILKQLKPEEVLKQYKPEEVLKQYKSEEVLKQYTLDEILSNFSQEEIENHLRKLKKKQK